VEGYQFVSVMSFVPLVLVAAVVATLVAFGPLAALLPVVPPILARTPHAEWLAMASFLLGKSLPL
jgi:hypothetical protein